MAKQYLVVATQFHGGGVLSRHRSALAAIKASEKGKSNSCCCGCNGVIVIDTDAAEGKGVEFECIQLQLSLWRGIECNAPIYRSESEVRSTASSPYSLVIT